MIRTSTIAAFALLIAASAFAQTSEFGVLVGGSKRLISHSDVTNGVGTKDNFTFSNSVTEAYYSVEIEPGTRFRVKGGQITAPVAFQFITPAGKLRSDVSKGRVEHIEGVVDYRFSEPFGSTGLFAGIGLYRQSGNVADAAVPANQQGRAEETNYGLTGGVNGDFPLSRRVGVIVEATYHAINYHYRPRYITATGGLRFSF